MLIIEILFNILHIFEKNLFFHYTTKNISRTFKKNEYKFIMNFLYLINNITSMKLMFWSMRKIKVALLHFNNIKFWITHFYNRYLV